MARRLKPNLQYAKAADAISIFVEDRRERIAQALGVTIGPVLGCGAWGCAYEIVGTDPPLVLKVTGDEQEARMWQKFWSLQKSGVILAGLPWIERVFWLRSDHELVTGEPIFGVVREGATPVLKLAVAPFTKMLGTREYPDQYTNEMFLSYVKHWKNMAPLFYGDEISRDRALALSHMEPALRGMKSVGGPAAPFAETLETLLGLGIPPVDLHRGNLALREREQFGRPRSFVFIDPGVTPGGEEVTGEKLVANPWVTAVCACGTILEEPIEELEMSNRLPGGRGDNLRPGDVDHEQLALGTAHEMEHTDDPAIAEEIALDHLAEDPAYYTHLGAMERSHKANPAERADPLARTRALVMQIEEKRAVHGTRAMPDAGRATPFAMGYDRAKQALVDDAHRGRLLSLSESDLWSAARGAADAMVSERKIPFEQRSINDFILGYHDAIEDWVRGKEFRENPTEHWPFKRTSKIGPGPLKQTLSRVDDWECTCGQYKCVCRGISADTRGKKKVIITDRERKAKYNKMYKEWVASGRRMRPNQLPKPPKQQLRAYKSSEAVKDFMEAEAPALAKKLKIKIGTRFGCGAWGCTYEIKSAPGMVVKVTGDLAEGEMWNRILSLQDKAELPGLPYVERVVLVKTNKLIFFEDSMVGSASPPILLYAIIREDITPGSPEVFSGDEDDYEARNRWETLDRMSEEFSGASRDFYNIPYSIEEHLTQLTDRMQRQGDLEKPFAQTLQALLNLRIPPVDVRGDNIGFRSEPKFGKPRGLVFTDPGVAPGGKPVKRHFVVNTGESPWVQALIERVPAAPLEEIEMDEMNKNPSVAHIGSKDVVRTSAQIDPTLPFGLMIEAFDPIDPEPMPEYPHSEVYDTYQEAVRAAKKIADEPDVRNVRIVQGERVQRNPEGDVYEENAERSPFEVGNEKARRFLARPHAGQRMRQADETELRGMAQQAAPLTYGGRDYEEYVRGFLAAVSDLTPNPGRRCPVGTQVQTLIFSKDDFTEKQAKSWAKKGGFKYGKVDEKENTWRLRQVEPDEFKKGSFRTIELDDGVKAVIGCPR